MSKHQQADGSIHEDQLLNYLVNSLDDEVALDLGENTQIDAEDIHEVPSARAPTGPRSRRFARKATIHPHENTVLYHLREKFDVETVERVGNSLLQKDVLDVLPVAGGGR